MKRLLVLLPLALVAVAGILFLKPAKPEMRKYRIGEQGLAEQGERSQEQLESIPLALVGGWELTAHEIEQVLGAMPPYRRFYYSTPEKMVMLVQNHALVHLLAHQALGRGLARDPSVLFALEETLAQSYKNDYLAQRVKPSDIGAQEVAAYLAAHPEAAGPGGQGANGVELAAKSAILEARRAAAWQEHLEELGLEAEAGSGAPPPPAPPPEGRAHMVGR
jgi:hypothetical protein